jgi:hypothetical protein
MKKTTKKHIKKATDYIWNYAKMTGLFPEFKKKRGDDNAKRDRQRSE